MTILDRIAQRGADPIILIARIAMAVLFVPDTYRKIININGWLASRSIAVLPFPPAWGLGAIVLLIIGIIGTILGYQARAAALALAIYTGFAAVLGHPVWIDPSQQLQFLKDVAIAAGLLVLFVHGPGRISLDGKRG